MAPGTFDRFILEMRPLYFSINDFTKVISWLVGRDKSMLWLESRLQDVVLINYFPVPTMASRYGRVDSVSYPLCVSYTVEYWDVGDHFLVWVATVVVVRFNNSILHISPA